MIEFENGCLYFEMKKSDRRAKRLKLSDKLCLWNACFENRKEEVKKLILFGVDKEVNNFLF